MSVGKPYHSLTARFYTGTTHVSLQFIRMTTSIEEKQENGIKVQTDNIQTIL